MTKVPVSAHYVDEGDSLNDVQEGKDQNRRISYSDMYSWLKISPEIVGITSAICDDLLGDNIEWDGKDGPVKEAQKFASTNYFRKKLYSVLQDYVLTGDGYLGVSGFITLTAMKRISSEMHKEGVELNPFTTMKKFRVRAPRANEPRNLFPLKTSTIKINYDKHGVVGSYVQKVDGIGTTVEFDPEEVIHLSLNNLGHDVYGYSAFWSCLNEIASLWYAKDYAGTFFQNDGTPDWMYTMEEETPKSANVKGFKREIKKMRASKNKHKSMVITGKVKAEKMNDFNKDMEFPKLVEIFTQRLMMAWNMPPTRLSNMQGNYRSSIEGNEGYYKKINRIQLEIEDQLNNELWWRFGDVKMRYKRVYKRDESREADIVNRLCGRPVLTPNEGRAYLGLKPFVGDPSMDEVQSKENPIGKTPEMKSGEEVGNQFKDAGEESG